MASLAHNLTAVNSSTPVQLGTATTSTHPITKNTINSWNSADFIIQNVDATATVYLGASNVTSSSYGYKLIAGSSVTISNLLPSTTLYAISSASSNIAVLTILK